VLSPLTTVFVLAVLWLIVVVPMLVRRNDVRRQERSIDGFGRAMQTLGHRSASSAHTGGSREVFVPRERHTTIPAVQTRRPVPAAQEALMYPVDRSQMSAARAQMMARRRRSLGLLGLGTVVFGILGVLMGGVFLILTAPFALGLTGYVYFLRSQALRDRERRNNRQQRANRRVGGYDATADLSHFDDLPESYVRIDDDDIELHNLDTVDLTGLYTEEAGEAAAQRRAS
jgi:hypothetical protein